MLGHHNRLSSQPDISHSIAQLCQVQQDFVVPKHIKMWNGIISCVLKTGSDRLKHCLLNRSSLELYVFVHSGYNTN